MLRLRWWPGDGSRFALSKPEMGSATGKKVRIMLWIGMALLGWQICFPVGTGGANHPTAVDEESVRPAVQKDPTYGSDHDDLDLDLATLCGIPPHLPFWLGVPLRSLQGSDDRLENSLLPVAGLQPSAP